MFYLLFIGLYDINGYCQGDFKGLHFESAKEWMDSRVAKGGRL